MLSVTDSPMDQAGRLSVVSATQLTPPSTAARKAAVDPIASVIGGLLGSSAILWWADRRGRLPFAIVSGVVVLVVLVAFVGRFVRSRPGEERVCGIAAIPSPLVASARYRSNIRSAPTPAWLPCGSLIRTPEGRVAARYGSHVYPLDELQLEPVLVTSRDKTVRAVRWMTADGVTADVLAWGTLRPCSAS